MKVPMHSLGTGSDDETREPIWGSKLGWVVGTDEAGMLLVDFEGNRTGRPLAARRTVPLEPEALRDAIATRQRAVLLFENGDPLMPLVVGLEQTPSSTPLLDAVLAQSAPIEEQPVEAHVDGKRVVIEGQDEIVLRCGQASITLRRNGRVVIKGTQIESHASGTHRIKGGSVQVN
ncbi:DUF6484 domain-containing protein [Vitiosangium sp. GDMCC 1.1324]|uniref:DUF6484 domain-containing protein n=1 Tax=Vitiosangium sp. (strain GDMCC 1.1324) TaxID=2138576 RepID=UPI000D3476E4|nr:DUF6484 domain-containing protein [Vitiosangium sp. GDMCC 1.1324]PTL82722.1 hypothetical protein DAT35_18285 [Vitiosangium sp. GDMCC 1.1324]